MDDQPWIISWQRLDKLDIQERLDWCRDNLSPGADYGYCSELRICVLKHDTAAVQYRLRWFDDNAEITDPVSLGLGDLIESSVLMQG